MPKVRNLSGCNNGNSTTSRSFSRESSAPPTSSYLTQPIWGKNIIVILKYKYTSSIQNHSGEIKNINVK
jgi:hypothetical protein